MTSERRPSRLGFTLFRWNDSDGFQVAVRLADHTSRIVEFRFATMIGETQGGRRSVCSFHGPPCAEEPSLATSQKYGAGNSVIIDTVA
jgi:hypothetical protein